MAAKKRQSAQSKYKRYYSKSSEAFDISEQNEFGYDLPKKAGKIKKGKSITKYKYEISSKNRYSFLTYFIIFLVFAGGIVTLSLVAKTSLLTMQINSMYDEIRRIEIENFNLKSELSTGYDLSEIEKIASMRLNMSRPQPHQIIHIDIEKGNSDTYGDAIYNIDTYEEEKTVFETVKDFFITVFN